MKVSYPNKLEDKLERNVRELNAGGPPGTPESDFNYIKQEERNFKSLAIAGAVGGAALIAGGKATGSEILVGMGYGILLTDALLSGGFYVTKYLLGIIF